MPDIPDAKSARDEALARVRENAGYGFRFNVFNEVRHLKGREMTGEDIRTYLENIGVKPRNGPNAWGGMIASLIKMGLLSKTGEYRPMIRLKSHARSTPVYRVM